MSNIHNELKQLATFSASQNPSVTRIVFSEEDMAARAYFKSICEALELSVRVDAVGNTFARWEGSDPKLPAIGTGSHIDAIPDSGQYDGTVGVFGGLAAIRYLKELGYTPKRSIEVLLFTSEEPTRFGIGCLGSRMLSGQLAPEEAKKLKDFDGKSLEEVLDTVGFNDNLDTVKLPENYYHAFVELHIEQGPILEKEGLDIGIVTMIAAPSSLSVKLVGEGGHAGGVLMPVRRDAGCAAAEIMLAVESIAKGTTSENTVATTGIFDIKPRAVNSIPKEAFLAIDLRDTYIETRDKALHDLQDKIKEVSERRGVTSTVKMLNCDPPAICAGELVSAVDDAVTELGYTSKKMISRAYHDSLFMAQICQTTMIFIPCKGGVSHRPDEYSSPEDIDKGVKTLALTMKALSA